MSTQDMSCKEIRQPIANICMNRLQAIADRATSLNDKVRSKLMPITAQFPVTPPSGCPSDTKIGETYPPLFDSMRNSMDTIEAALDSIEFSTDRAEI